MSSGYFPHDCHLRFVAPPSQNRHRALPASDSSDEVSGTGELVSLPDVSALLDAMEEGDDPAAALAALTRASEQARAYQTVPVLAGPPALVGGPAGRMPLTMVGAEDEDGDEAASIGGEELWTFGKGTNTPRTPQPPTMLLSNP